MRELFSLPSLCAPCRSWTDTTRRQRTPSAHCSERVACGLQRPCATTHQLRSLLRFRVVDRRAGVLRRRVRTRAAQTADELAAMDAEAEDVA